MFDIKTDNFETMIQDIYNLLSYIMEQHYVIIENPVLISKEPSVFEFDENVSFVHQFYYIKIKSKLSNVVYKVYYSKYKYIDKKRRELSGDYRIILNIVPDDAKITKYGLYDKIVSAGVYIYKPMDYESQLGLIPDLEKITKLRDVVYYNFIGNYLNDIFPLNKIYVEKRKIV